jgi:hypothetical protein
MGIDTAECGKEVYESLSNTNGEAILLIEAHLGLVTRDGKNEKIKKDGKTVNNDRGKEEKMKNCYLITVI